MTSICTMAIPMFVKSQRFSVFTSMWILAVKTIQYHLLLSFQYTRDFWRFFSTMLQLVVVYIICTYVEKMKSRLLVPFVIYMIEVPSRICENISECGLLLGCQRPNLLSMSMGDIRLYFHVFISSSFHF